MKPYHPGVVFRAIDIPEDKALRAADADVHTIKRDLDVLKWMVGTLYPLVIAILLKLFLH